MNVQYGGARQLMETSDPETVNQYLRFGWTLINQYVIEATNDSLARTNYVLASIRKLEETRQLITVHDTAQANRYLQLGWTLIEKFVTSAVPTPPKSASRAKPAGPAPLAGQAETPANPATRRLESPRHELINFVLAWQTEGEPVLPDSRAARAASDLAEHLEGEIELELG